MLFPKHVSIALTLTPIIFIHEKTRLRHFLQLSLLNSGYYHNKTRSKLIMGYLFMGWDVIWVVVQKQRSVCAARRTRGVEGGALVAPRASWVPTGLPPTRRLRCPYNLVRWTPTGFQLRYFFFCFLELHTF